MHYDLHRLEPRPLAAMLPAIHLFVLLLLTLMVIPFWSFDHYTRIPLARTAAPAMKDRVTVGVDKNGSVWMYDVSDPGPIPAANLAQRLHAAFADRAGEELYLVADRHVEYARVQQVITAARQVGVREVQLIVACPGGSESLTRQCGSHPRS